MTSTYHVIKGHYREDDGTLEPGTLDLLAEGGQFVDDAVGIRGVLIARRYPVCAGVTDIEITSSVGAWQFVVAEGECERIGMPIQ